MLVRFNFNNHKNEISKRKYFNKTKNDILGILFDN